MVKDDEETQVVKINPKKTGRKKSSQTGKSTPELKNTDKLTKTDTGTQTKESLKEESPPDPETALAEETARAEEYRDKMLRIAAEFDNFKKRMETERRRFIEYGREEALLSFLPVLDDLERAVESARVEDTVNEERDTETPESDTSDEEINDKNIKEGVEIILKKFRGVLESLGVVPVEVVGEPFDPEVAEAVGTIPTDEVEEGTIVQQLQAGYRIGDRILRPARVMVAIEPPSEIV